MNLCLRTKQWGVAEVGVASHCDASPARTAKRPEYLFIHTVRFWSMLAIVFLHCAGEFTRHGTVSLAETGLLVQPFKFGTIGFFIISGFLVGDRLPASNRGSYLRRRAKRLIPAWALWYGLEVVSRTRKDLLLAHGAWLNPGAVLATIPTAAGQCLTGTAMWFVPNFMVALTCIVMLRRWLNDLRLGGILLAVNLFYGVNVYTRWIPSMHEEALFGFVFYLWLGAWCSLRKERIQSWAAAQSGWWLSLWACAAAGLAMLETVILRAHHSPDDFNSLRFGNQIYSVLMVILLVRFKRRTWPAFINVAETTYGVYLTHGIVISLVFTCAMRVVPVQVLDPFGVLVVWAVLAPVVYYVALQLTRAIASMPWSGWAVGATNARPERRSVPAPAVVVTQPVEV